MGVFSSEPSRLDRQCASMSMTICSYVFLECNSYGLWMGMHRGAVLVEDVFSNSVMFGLHFFFSAHLGDGKRVGLTCTRKGDSDEPQGKLCKLLLSSKETEHPQEGILDVLVRYA